MAYELKLEGKVAIVTGAGGKPSQTGAPGTGRAIALHFAQHGARVVVVDRHDDRAAETVQEIERGGGEACEVVLDLTAPSAPGAIVEKAVSAFGRVDVLVNNAAVFFLKPVVDTTTDEYDQSVAVNLTAPFMLSKAAIPAMIEAGGGSIVNISSVAAMRGAPTGAYAASKAGMMGLTTSIVASYGKQGVRANTIAVGAVDTPLRRASVPGEYVPRDTPMGIEGDAWDIARVALFLASPDSRLITGVLLPVDGGLTAMCPR